MSDFLPFEEGSPVMMMKEGDVMNIEINEETACEIMAVPGGWIYTRYHVSQIHPHSRTFQGMVFVPRPQVFGGIDLGKPIAINGGS